MENLLMKYKNSTGCTYRNIANKVEVILKKNGETVKVYGTTIEDYAKGKSMPQNDVRADAVAELLGVTTKELLENFSACKKAG